jgi:hypothetical protein
MLDRGAFDTILTDAARARMRTAAEARCAPPGEPAAAKAVAVQRDRRGVRTVTVACPYCPPTRGGNPRLHVHGWPDDAEKPGYRGAHCGGVQSRDVSRSR